MSNLSVFLHGLIVFEACRGLAVIDITWFDISLKLSSINIAIPAIVGDINKLLSESLTDSCSPMRTITCVASNEWPPNSKKLS
jgi:hypothetical protein